MSNLDIDEIASFAAALSQSFLLCRELGHNWRPYHARLDPDHHVYIRVIRCTRCRTERHQTISLSGHVLSSGYTYPEGYQRKGYGRIDGEGRDRLRLESISRVIKSDEEGVA